MKGIQSALNEIGKKYKLLLSVQNGTYIQKSKNCFTAEEIEKEQVKYYGSLQNAIDSEKDYINSFVVVELEKY